MDASTRERAMQRIAELKQRLDDLRSRLPAHSVPAAMIIEMEDIEEELARLKADLQERG